MSLESHIEALSNRHSDLSAEVKAAQSSPGFDNLEISRLKRKRLFLKDQIRQLDSA